MKITLKVADGRTIEFDSVARLAQHYGDLGSSFRNMSMNQKTIRQARFYEGKAAAYDVVSWQLHNLKIEE